MSRWGENLGAPRVCHVSEVIRAGFEPGRAAVASIEDHPEPRTLHFRETPLDQAVRTRWAQSGAVS